MTALDRARIISMSIYDKGKSRFTLVEAIDTARFNGPAAGQILVSGRSTPFSINSPTASSCRVSSVYPRARPSRSLAREADMSCQ